jgi:hypothetical protein
MVGTHRSTSRPGNIDRGVYNRMQNPQTDIGPSPPCTGGAPITKGDHGQRKSIELSRLLPFRLSTTRANTKVYRYVHQIVKIVTRPFDVLWEFWIDMLHSRIRRKLDFVLHISRYTDGLHPVHHFPSSVVFALIQSRYSEPYFHDKRPYVQRNHWRE